MAWMGWAVVALAAAGAGDGSPEPWETAASFLEVNPGSVALASGVIVESGDRRTVVAAERRTVILTTGRFLGPRAVNASPMQPYPAKIDVYLYPGRLVAGTKTLHGFSERVEGKLLAYDRATDLALITIPRWGLDASPLVAEGWEATKAGVLVTVGWHSLMLHDFKIVVANTEIVPREEGRPRALTPQGGFRALVCRWEPGSGMGGSGLFDGEGRLIGICRDVDFKAGRAYYVGPREVRTFLERNRVDTKGTRDRGKTESLLASGEAKVKAGMRAEGLAELEEAARRLEEMTRRVEAARKGTKAPAFHGPARFGAGPVGDDPSPLREDPDLIRSNEESLSSSFPNRDIIGAALTRQAEKSQATLIPTKRE